MPGQIYVISGPSGVGKSTIIRLLRKSVPDLAYSVSHTSRKPRNREVDGVDYYFVDEAAFKNLIEKKDFVEWAKVYGDYYGTSFSSLKGQIDKGCDVVLDIDSQGAKNLKEKFEASILVYLMPPSLGALENRLKKRNTDSEEVISRRIKKALSELKNCSWYDYIIFNDDIDKAVREIESIIISDSCRSPRNLGRIRETFNISIG